ncbi:helix-turn-helix transcriptional regulator [Sphingomonas floccifaciens]|jgi:prophage regulatory protein|uniref:Helix-turn-helix transcriptional regulator n=1 Tax=Sphingomonas floccifaciens TaxID=1844115 RepID=A0ABW4N960_9SPHN
MSDFTESAAIDRILRRAEVCQLIGLSRSSLYLMMEEGRFPRPIRLGRRAVGWKARAVDEWINQREIACRTNGS